MQAELNIEGMHCDSCAVVQQSTLLKKIQDLGYQATVSGQSQSEVGA